MADILEAALRYVELGYWVYPVNLTLDDKGKKRVHFPGNWRDSTNNPDRVRELWNSNVTGIAIDTGKSGVVVVDIDESAGKSGMSYLQESGISLPETTSRVRTWSGGFHGYFRQPAQRIGSGANRPVQYVDYRGDGGVVFAPPTLVRGEESSSLAVVGRYSEITPVLPVDALPVLPEYYASRLRDKPSTATLGDRLGGPLPGAPSMTRDPFKPVRGPSLRDDQIKVLERFVEADLDIIRQAGNGERNEALGRTALLADRCLKLGYDYEGYLDLVLEAYHASGGTDDQQAKDWVRSSWKKANAEPLPVPKTYIDDMAEKEYARILSRRMATTRLTGTTSQMINEGSFVDWTVTPQPAPFWLRGVIPQGEQVILFGKPEAGKTFLALDWAMSISLGLETMSRKTTQGKVWFCAGEGQARITSRMHAWMDHHDIDVDPTMFRLLNHAPDLMNDQVIEHMAQRIAEDEVDLIVIDTLGRAMQIGGGNPSEVADAAQALRSLQALSKYRPSTTPLVIHHPVKDGGMAGAYNLLGGVDVVLLAERDEDTGSLRHHKNKDGEKKTLYEYEWKPVGQSAVLVPLYPEYRNGHDETH